MVESPDFFIVALQLPQPVHENSRFLPVLVQFAVLEVLGLCYLHCSIEFMTGYNSNIQTNVLDLGMDPV